MKHALYTDVGRDGDLSGVNIEATARLAQETGLNVIASGGVASLADLVGLRQTGQIAGVVIGKALYTGAFTLQDALRIAKGEVNDPLAKARGLSLALPDKSGIRDVWRIDGRPSTEVDVKVQAAA